MSPDSRSLLRQVERKPGDVLDYIPDQHHCHEGTAIVNERGYAVDTFWSSDGHVLNDRELATAGLRFRLSDFREIEYEVEWLTYAPTDRQIITRQHGLQRTYYVRIGAQPDLATQIENAREKVEEAERGVSSAKSRLQFAIDDLRKLEAQRA